MRHNKNQRGDMVYGKCPLELLNTPGITLQEIRAYIAIDSCVGKNEIAFPGLKTIGERAGIHPVNASRALRKLEKRGWIVINRRGRGRTNTYSVLAQCAKSDLVQSTKQDLAQQTKSYIEKKRLKGKRKEKKEIADSRNTNLDEYVPDDIDFEKYTQDAELQTQASFSFPFEREDLEEKESANLDVKQQPQVVFQEEPEISIEDEVAIMKSKWVTAVYEFEKSREERASGAAA